MALALLILFTVAACVASLVLTVAVAKRLSRWAEERHVRNYDKTALALRLIPKPQVVIAYVALILVVAALLGWFYTGGWIRTASLVTASIAVAYLVWFSVRWRHLR